MLICWLALAFSWPHLSFFGPLLLAFGPLWLLYSFLLAIFLPHLPFLCPFLASIWPSKSHLMALKMLFEATYENIEKIQLSLPRLRLFVRLFFDVFIQLLLCFRSYFPSICTKRLFVTVWLVCGSSWLPSGSSWLGLGRPKNGPGAPRIAPRAAQDRSKTASRPLQDRLKISPRPSWTPSDRLGSLWSPFGCLLASIWLLFLKFWTPFWLPSELLRPGFVF